MDGGSADVADARRNGPSRWLLWRPREPRWVPLAGPTASPDVPLALDYVLIQILVATYVALQWVVVVLIAPVVFAVRTVGATRGP
jgi:hypothetical protein